MTDWNKFKIKPGTLMQHPETGVTAIILLEERDDLGYHWWWILDSDGHRYMEKDSHLRNFFRRGMWRIVQEAEDETG